MHIPCPVCGRGSGSPPFTCSHCGVGIPRGAETEASDIAGSNFEASKPVQTLRSGKDHADRTAKPGGRWHRQLPGAA